MYAKLSLFVAFILSSILFYSCSEDPTSAGLSVLNNEDLIFVSPDSSFVTSNKNFTKEVNYRGANYLLLGKYNNLNSTMLLEFSKTGLIDTVLTAILNNSVSVSEARVEMTPVYQIGGSANLDFSVSKISSGWPAGTAFNADSLKAIAGNMVPVSKSGLSITDSLYTFNLDNQSVLSWFKDTSKTIIDLALNPNLSINKMVGFQSSYNATATNVMKLRVVFEKRGIYKDTLTFSINNNLHILQGSASNIVPADRIVLQGGTGLHAMVKFDFPKIPASSIINSATVEFTVDPATSDTGKPMTPNLIAMRLLDSTSNSYSFDSSFTVSLTRSNNVYSGSITQILQKWVLTQQNFGLALAVGNEKGTVDRISLFGQKTALRPRLKIVYTAKKP